LPTRRCTTAPWRCISPHAPNYLMGGIQAQAVRQQSRATLAPYANFPTRGGNIVIGAGNDAQFRKLTQMLGKPDLAGRSALQDQQGSPRQQGGDGKRARGAHEGSRRRVLRRGADVGRVPSVRRCSRCPTCWNIRTHKHRNMVWEKDGYRKTSATRFKLSRTPPGVA